MSDAGFVMRRVRHQKGRNGMDHTPPQRDRERLIAELTERLHDQSDAYLEKLAERMRLRAARAADSRGTDGECPSRTSAPSVERLKAELANVSERLDGAALTTLVSAARHFASLRPVRPAMPGREAARRGGEAYAAPRPPAPPRAFVRLTLPRGVDLFGMARAGDVVVAKRVGNRHDLPRTTPAARRIGLVDDDTPLVAVGADGRFVLALWRVERVSYLGWTAITYLPASSRPIRAVVQWRRHPGLRDAEIYRVVEVQPATPRPWTDDADLVAVAGKLGGGVVDVSTAPVAAAVEPMTRAEAFAALQAMPCDWLYPAPDAPRRRGATS